MCVTTVQQFLKAAVKIVFRENQTILNVNLLQLLWDRVKYTRDKHVMFVLKYKSIL